MEILAELHAKHKNEKLRREIKLLEGYDGFDIPDGALGQPSVIPSVTGTLVREILGEEKRVLINQRLADVNELYVRSLSITARMMNFEVAYTKGDRPTFGKEVNQVTTERAIEITREYGVKSGAMLSLRKGRDEILRRLDMKADFFLALHFAGLSSIEGLELDKIIPYLIVSTDKNREIIKTISQPTFDENRVLHVVRELEGFGVRAVLISSPADLNFLVNFIAKI